MKVMLKIQEIIILKLQIKFCKIYKDLEMKFMADLISIVIWGAVAYQAIRLRGEAYDLATHNDDDFPVDKPKCSGSGVCGLLDGKNTIQKN